MAKIPSTIKESSGISGDRKTSQDLYQSVYQPKYPSKKKASKGEVVVEIFKNRLRLRWSYLGKRYCLSIGLPDRKVNRLYAERKARQIEGDIATGNFDSTLRKYKSLAAQKLNQISAVALFEKFTQSKAKYLAKPTLAKYAAVSRYFTDYFRGVNAAAITVEAAEGFTDWLVSQIEPITAKDRVSLIKACWQWGISQDLVEFNPWLDITKHIKVKPKQMPKPFTREEIGAIIQGFKTDRYYHPYTDFVEFLFGTGCRTGEAIGLKWRHVSDDCSTVWIGESLSRGVRKSTKTNKARIITLTPNLRAMLLVRRPNKLILDELVFTAPEGGAINDNNFRNRAWKTVLTRLEIDYRKPYTTRHTLISHALDLGMNPVMVAQLTGHDVETLYENYAGNVNSRPRLPELL